MNLDLIFSEIAFIRIRQRRILQALKDANLLDWDGDVDASDKETQEIVSQLKADFDADNHSTEESTEGKPPLSP